MTLLRPRFFALLFFLARAANAAAHFAAAWLAARIGLVNTIVFTHIPSSLLLMAVPFAPTFSIAALLFLLRECLVEMDVPTRQSYVMAVVLPEERTMASGVTHLVRMGGWAVAPLLAGPLMQGLALATPAAGRGRAEDCLRYGPLSRLPAPQAAGRAVDPLLIRPGARRNPKASVWCPTVPKKRCIAFPYA